MQILRRKDLRGMGMILRKLFCAVIALVCLCLKLSFASDIREPNVSGSFYPDDPKELSLVIDADLSKVTNRVISGDPGVIVSPHAGYQYSAGVAAFGYSLLAENKFDTVVIIAPSHAMAFSGVAVWPQGFFRTPLGDVPVDSDSCARLMESDPGVKENREAFSAEHSLEVQLPFLQKSLKNFRIIPLLCGEMTLADAQLLAHSLSLLKKERGFLVVVSTDLSHYHAYEDANRIDAGTIFYLKGLDPQGLYAAFLSGKSEACGIFPLLTGIFYAREAGFNGVDILKYANSGDVTGGKEKVVGYLSAVIRKEGGSGMLSLNQKERLLTIARNSIATYLKTGKKTQLSEKDAVLLQERGAFVTLHENGQLRGCIGNLMGSGPLYLTVRDMAVEAATGDPRFSPLTQEELTKTEIEISVLSPMERVYSADKINLGTHGVLIKKGFRSGVFLPQVATETGWSKEEFLGVLCAQKAGLPASAWKDKDTEMYIFSADVFSEKELKGK